MKLSRREFLEAGAALGAATIAGCAGPMGASASLGRSDPGAIRIPVQGSASTFIARRIFRCELAEAPASLAFAEASPDTLRIDPPGTTVDRPYPPATRDYRPRIAVVACVGRGGRDIAVDRALDHVFGFAAGIDLVMSPIVPTRESGPMDRGPAWLKVNGQFSQAGSLDAMGWSVARQLAQLSRVHELRPGDVLFCAMPGEARAVLKGDVLTGHVEGIHDISVRVV